MAVTQPGGTCHASWLAGIQGSKQHFPACDQPQQAAAEARQQQPHVHSKSASAALLP
jgi:hypothetical protein